VTTSRSSFVVVALAAAALPGLKSPSGNIRCAALPTVLHCDVAHAAYARQLQRRCQAVAGVDWHGFELTRSRRGGFVCSGGIWYAGGRPPRYVTLPYGRTWRYRAFACRSRVTGVTCTSRGGHGLFISRASWRAW
jgi:hypothetical protein